MKSLNQCNFIGNLSKDPELSYTATGIAVAKFSIALNEQWKDDNNDKKERTTWVNIVAFRKLAEICGQYLKKGNSVFITGKLQVRTWDDKATGTKRYMTEIVAENLVMLGGKSSGNETSEPESSEPTVAGEPEKDDLPF